MLELFPQLVASGLSAGMLYGIVALSLTLAYRVTTVVNFGHGDFVMAGACVIFLLLQAQVPFALAVMLGALFVFAVGCFVQMVLMRPILDGPHLSLSMLALAVGFVLRGIARLEWGAVPLALPRPYPSAAIDLGPLSITSDDIFIAAATILVVTLLSVLLRLAPIGKVIQAIFQTRRGAELVGINVPLVQGLMWGGAAALAGVSGALLGLTMLLTPDMGTWTLLRGFAAMAIGGFGSIPGAIVGGLLLGVVEKLLGFYVSTLFIEITAYMVTMLVLLVLPRGLFGAAVVQRV
jgi:branched-chain amino acid transport system permease protein